MSDDIYDPFSRFDKSNQIHPTAIIHDCVKLGKNNVIGAYCVIGSDGEIRDCPKFEGEVHIGDGNRISELVTIQRPAGKDAATKIGNNNLIMAHTHIGHDAGICDGCELSTGTIVGGYALIESGAKIKLGVTIRNRKVIGKDAIVGMGAVVVSDIPAGEIWVGTPARKHIKIK
jgi:UDP-N-acetylglucosamine acyltransferase